eukprot:jgi/Chlat1/7634/Chrsp64S07111
MVMEVYREDAGDMLYVGEEACGFLWHMNARGVIVHGIDPAPVILPLPKMCESLSLMELLASGSPASLGHPSDSFGLVIASNLLENVPPSLLGPVLRELARVSRADVLVAIREVTDYAQDRGSGINSDVVTASDARRRRGRRLMGGGEANPVWVEESFPAQSRSWWMEQFAMAGLEQSRQRLKLWQLAFPLWAQPEPAAIFLLSKTPAADARLYRTSSTVGRLRDIDQQEQEFNTVRRKTVAGTWKGDRFAQKRAAEHPASKPRLGKEEAVAQSVAVVKEHLERGVKPPGYGDKDWAAHVARAKAQDQDYLAKLAALDADAANAPTGHARLYKEALALEEGLARRKDKLEAEERAWEARQPRIQPLLDANAAKTSKYTASLFTKPDSSSSRAVPDVSKRAKLLTALTALEAEKASLERERVDTPLKLAGIKAQLVADTTADSAKAQVKRVQGQVSLQKYTAARAQLDREHDDFHRDSIDPAFLRGNTLNVDLDDR